MIDSALIFIQSRLDQYLKNKFGLDESVTVLNNLVDASGSVSQKNQNKVVITLINLEQETSKQFYGGKSRNNTQVTNMMPSVHFNLDVLFTANFDSYDESLKFLTATVAFIQPDTSFNRKNQPELPIGITALKFEIENSPYEKTHNLWSALGAKYQPSIIYKIRHVSVQAEQILGTVASVQQTSSEATPS